MANILIKSISAEETFLIESILKKMKISYEKKETEFVDFSEEQKESIKRGLEQADNKQLKPAAEVRAKAREICGI
ncbi:MAG: hypothetical protein Q4G16_07975 [Cruoricaptor ignavus]|nr:hypothetical protein [Cruoricaptor ignavus]